MRLCAFALMHEPKAELLPVIVNSSSRISNMNPGPLFLIISPSRDSASIFPAGLNCHGQRSAQTDPHKMLESGIALHYSADSTWRKTQ
jgi:hypothetical protein